MQPFDTNLAVDLDDGLQVCCRGVQCRGEISFDHEQRHDSLPSGYKPPPAASTVCSPFRIAYAAASVRLAHCVLFRMLRTCVATVFRLIANTRETSLLVR